MTGAHPAWQWNLRALNNEFYDQNDAICLGLLVWLSDVPLILGGSAGSGKSSLIKAFHSLAPQVQKTHPAITSSTTQANEQGVMVWMKVCRMPISYADVWANSAPKVVETEGIDWLWAQQQTSVGISDLVLNQLEQVRVALEQGGLWLSLKRWGFVMRILKTAALVQQRHEVISEDLWLLPYIIDNHVRYRAPVHQRVASVLMPSGGVSRQCQLEVWLAEIDGLESDIEQTLNETPHTVERLKEFKLELRGQDTATYRLLYSGEESHLRKDDYQRLTVGAALREVNLYQPQAVLGVSPRVERVAMKLMDSLTLVDSTGQSYFLLTQSITLPAHFSSVQAAYFQQQLDALTLRIFEDSQQEQLSEVVGLAALLSPIVMSMSDEEEQYERVLMRIKKCKEKVQRAQLV